MATTTSLTQAQLATLKASMAANTAADFVPLRTAGNTGGMAAWYNVYATPAYYTWQYNYPPQEIWNAMSLDGLGLSNLLQADSRALMPWADYYHDMGNVDVRNGVDDMCGTQTGLASLIINGAKITTRRGEVLYATGNGAIATPSTAGYVGTISNQNVVDALLMP